MHGGGGGIYYSVPRPPGHSCAERHHILLKTLKRKPETWAFLHFTKQLCLRFHQRAQVSCRKPRCGRKNYINLFSALLFFTSSLGQTELWDQTARPSHNNEWFLEGSLRGNDQKSPSPQWLANSYPLELATQLVVGRDSKNEEGWSGTHGAPFISKSLAP